MKSSYDLIVIGAGSGGLVVASAASSMGARVMLVESRLMGGDCLNYGCVPSKTFLKSAHLAKELKEASNYGLHDVKYEVSVKDVMKRVRSVIEEIAPHDSKERFEGLGVDVVLGFGKVVGKNQVMVDDKTYTGKRIVIATGSTAFIPPIKGLDTVEYITNEEVFEMDYNPKKMVVLGAGPIGLELGQGFANLGVDVHIIDRAAKLFGKDEVEVADIMERVLTEDGVNLHLGASIVEVYQKDEMKVVVFEIDGKKSEVECDTLIVALGRTPNTKNMGLEEVGIEKDRFGFIVTNDYLETTVKNIYAVGDCKGKFLFTHAASYEASVVVKNALVRKMFKTNYFNMAWTTYTSPEVAHVGMLEKDAKKENVLGKVYMLPIDKNDRAKADDDRNGFVKVIVDKKGIVIGATIVSNIGGELITTLSLLISKKMKLSSLLSVIYQYPVQGEILKSVALVEFKEGAKDWQKAMLKKIVQR